MAIDAPQLIDRARRIAHRRRPCIDPGQGSSPNAGNSVLGRPGTETTNGQLPRPGLDPGADCVLPTPLASFAEMQRLRHDRRRMVGAIQILRGGSQGSHLGAKGRAGQPDLDREARSRPGNESVGRPSRGYRSPRLPPQPVRRLCVEGPKLQGPLGISFCPSLRRVTLL